MGIADFLGMSSNSNTGAPQVDPSRFGYMGASGGSLGQQGFYQNQGTQAQYQQGPQIQNGYDQRDQGAVQGTLGDMSNLAGGYENLLNGKNSQATAQMNAATDQAIQAQMAMANSEKGSLAGAMATRNAATTGSQELQNAAQQSAVLRAQEEQMALGGLSSLYTNQGQLALGEQGLNANQALAQAQLEEQQRGLNNQMTLGSEGLGNQIGLAQLQAGENEQQLQSGNQLASEQMGMQQQEFNAQQNSNLIGGLAGAAAGAMLAADADFQEPSRIGRPTVPARSTLGPRGYADGDMQPPAHLTMREERPVDDRPFLVLADQNNHTVGRVKVDPLDARERARVAEPHGAGPLFDDRRVHTTMHDMGLASMAGGQVGDMGAAAGGMPGAYAGGMAGAAGAQAGQQMGGSGLAHIVGGALQGFGAGSHGQLASLPDAMAMRRAAMNGYGPPPAADLDLDEHRLASLYTDAKLGTGARFAHLEHQLAARPGVHDAGALAAYIGRKNLGAHRMAQLAAHGRK